MNVNKRNHGPDSTPYRFLMIFFDQNHNIAEDWVSWASSVKSPDIHIR